MRLSLIGDVVRAFFKGDTKGNAGWGIFLFKVISSTGREDRVFLMDANGEVFVGETGGCFEGDAPEDRVVLLLQR